MFRNILICFLIFMAILCLWPRKIAAEEEIHSSINNVTVLPAKFELSSTLGQTINQSLQIVNDSDIEYLYALSVDNISVTGENGEVGLGDGTGRLSNLFASWINVDQPSGKLEPNSTKIIKFKINVPQVAEPGGKYASIVISLDRVLRNPGESAAEAKVVSLMMLTVAGGYDDKAQLLDFKASPLVDGKMRFTTRIRNQGVAHIKPHGTIVITNLFGRKVDSIDIDSENVLPGSVRKTSIFWQPKNFIFGIYHATLVANYGKNDGEILTAVTKFTNFPFWPTTILTVIILAVLYFAVVGLKGYLRHKR